MLDILAVLDDPPFASPTCGCERCERTRVRAHFVGAVGLLLSRPGAGEARRRRLAVVGELIRYALRGRFPQNEVVRERRAPIFVDRVGTRCAVAHWLERAGEHRLVDDVAATSNGALFADLAGDTRLRAWLDHWHLTEAEATRIQPCYTCPEADPVQDCACGLEGIDATFVGTVSKIETGDLVLTVDEAFGSAVVAPGDVITRWRSDGSLEIHPHQHVLGTATAEGITILYEYLPATQSVETSSCPGSCPPLYNGPSDVPLQVFIDVATGASCATAFDAQSGWDYRPGGSDYEPGGACYFGGDEVAGSGEVTGGAGGGGGSEFGPNLGLPPAPSTAIDHSGCGIAGADLLDPTTQGLLWVLVAGVAAARRRRARAERP